MGHSEAATRAPIRKIIAGMVKSMMLLDSSMNLMVGTTIDKCSDFISPAVTSTMYEAQDLNGLSNER